MGGDSSKMKDIDSRLNSIEQRQVEYQTRIQEQIKAANDDIMRLVVRSISAMNNNGITGDQYSMRSNEENKVGYCLLINNSKRPERDVAVQVNKVQSLFENFHFNVNVETKRTAGEIAELLRGMSDCMENYSCVIVILISAGKVLESGELVFFDHKNGETRVRDIWTPFTGQDTWERKPKIFLFEIERYMFDSTSLDTYPLNKSQYPGKAVQQLDILIVHPVKYSPKSWFLDTLCHVFELSATDKDVVSLLKDKEQSLSDDFKFTFESTLAAKIHFCHF